MARIAVFLVMAVMVLGAPLWPGAGGARAQSLDLAGGDGAQPITIDAPGGIEWNQNEKVFTATGRARATRGDLVVDADELRAYYREVAGGGSELYRLDAIGNVRITQPGRVATGGHAVYDVDKTVIVLKDGNPVTLTAGADVITAKEQLEFWDKRQLAVARGDAEAVRADKRIRANVLTAHFAPGDGGKSEVERIDAFDNVRIDTNQDQIFADRAAYNVPSGLARLTGSVKIKRGNNEVNGCSADIDLNTGINRMNSCEGPDGAVTGTTGAGAPGGASDATPQTSTPARVHGVLAPKSE